MKSVRVSGISSLGELITHFILFTDNTQAYTELIALKFSIY